MMWKSNNDSFYASLESEKNILHFKLYTERLHKEPSDFLVYLLWYGVQTSRLECMCQVTGSFNQTSTTQ